MMNNNQIAIFEQIKKINEYRQEFWSARQLAKTLDYIDYRNFKKAICKAKESCKNAGESIRNHFVDINEMIELGKTASRQIKDVALSRYACYLIMQNADPSKKVRKTIKELGGTMPEKLPASDGIGRAKRRLKKVGRKELLDG